MRFRGGRIGWVFVAIDLLVALSVGVSLAMESQIVRILTCIGRSLNDPPCEPIVMSSGAGPWAPFAAVLLIGSPALLAGWWWWVHRARSGGGPQPQAGVHPGGGVGGPSETRPG